MIVYIYSDSQNIHKSSILVHMHQKKLALEIAAKIASVNGLNLIKDNWQGYRNTYALDYHIDIRVY